MDVRARVEMAVARFARQHAPWQPGETVVAAVSSGPDSLCMLGALLALQSEWPAVAPGRIVIAHLDHSLRGAEGAADAAWVAAFAASLNVACVTAIEDVNALARREHRSLEDAARRARYAFLRRVAAEQGAACICVGHTRDDQVETIVMHWLRGSGLTGLSGMRPLAGDVARPLLAVSRDDTVAYCAARGWEPRRDVTNDDPVFLRNRIRHELLPVLERYNPNLRETLLREAELFREDDLYLEDRTSALWTESLVFESPVVLRFSRPILRAAPPALRRRLVRRAATRFGAGDAVPEAKHVLALESLVVRGRTGASLDLPGRLRVTLEYATLNFERQPQSGADSATASTATSEARFSIPGSFELPEVGWRLIATLEPEIPLLSSWHPWASPYVVDPVTGHHLCEELLLDADVAGAALTMRTWRPGDRMRPLGMSGHKKLQDMFVDGGVPRSLRHRLPLVFSTSHLLCIAGLYLDERARVTPQTRRALRLRLEPLSASDTGNTDLTTERG